jgi:hypothetical protein
MISYIAFGLGMLTKGPVAILLPGLAIIIFLLGTHTFNWAYFLKLKPLWIFLVLVFVISPWYILIGIQTQGAWIHDFFLRHNLQRYTDAMEGHNALFLVTPFMLLIGLLPFSIFTIQAYRHGWIQRKKDPLLLYSGIISLTFVVFFATSQTKLPNYTVPAYPFVALLTGRYLDVLQEKFMQFRKSIHAALWTYLAIALTLPIGLYLGLKFDPVLSEYRHLSFYFLLIPAGAILAMLFIYKSKYKGMLLSLSLSWIISSLLFFYVIFPKIDKENPVAKLLPSIDMDKPLIAYKIYNSSFSFYIRKPIPTFDTMGDLKNQIDKIDEGYILTRKSYSEELEQVDDIELIGEAKDIFEIPTTVVYKIK